MPTTAVRMTALEDHVPGALRGEDAAWAGLYDGLAPHVLRYQRALGLDRSDQEDAVQETFVRLVRELPRWEPARPLRPFALGIARHVALDHLRRVSTRERAAEGLAAEGVSRARTEPGASERAQAVRAALAAVEPDLRTLLVLRHESGLTMSELAVAAGCSVPTAREQLRRAARRFAVELRQRDALPGGAA